MDEELEELKKKFLLQIRVRQNCVSQCLPKAAFIIPDKLSGLIKKQMDRDDQHDGSYIKNVLKQWGVKEDKE